ncbi:MAG: hypothetical protein DMF69_17400 [Acidobacteria bacterium]|nr:MAG: hypothetical protein DMF69_17400 [Acidobacteriota bacterium]
MRSKTQQRDHTTGQVRAIFGEARRCGLDNELLHELVADVIRGSSPTVMEGAVSIKSLTFAQAEAVIQKLKGKSFVPLRTLQYRRQSAGIKQVVQEGQLKLIADLASQREGWTAETLVNFCKRQCGHHPLRTTEDANKVIEALKSMNQREGLWAA